MPEWSESYLENLVVGLRELLRERTRLGEFDANCPAIIEMCEALHSIAVLVRKHEREIARLKGELDKPKLLPPPSHYKKQNGRTRRAPEA